MAAATEANQKRFVALFPQGQLVPVDSGHAIPDDVAIRHLEALLDAAG